MTFMKWAATAAVVAVTAFVSGCGGGGSDSNAAIRLINASVGYSTLDLTVNGNTVGTGIAYGAASDYSNQNVNATTATIANNGTTVLAPTMSSVSCPSRCSLVAYGWNGSIARTIIQENRDQPAAGTSTLYLLNLAPDAGSLDFYLTASPTAALTTPVASSVAGGTGAVTVQTIGTAGSNYTLTITGAGQPNDVRLQVPSISLPALQTATFIATATSGGTLVNGMMAIQNGAVTNYLGTNARLRVVSGITGVNSTTPSNVGAYRNALTLLDPALISPAIGDYTTVPPGSDPVTININGSPFTLPSQPTLASGGDYTLLLWGVPGNVQSKLIADDNRLPTTAGTAKFRLTNALTNQAGGLNLAVNYSPLVSNVLPGFTGVPAQPLTVSSVSVDLQVQAGSNVLYDVPTLTVQQGSVYEVMMLGDAAVSSQYVKILRTAR
ncbi:DUF4397 domain-containing protein [Paucibacter sp. R3-3]|uniref:DUF4397 domain-containing protein n=1 Tax=Roseateles agri TaxID=3098619 RepID=A0ABU5DF29_9BURK|nr:DUF4397 domain-containing protein [Paucibacter sp. R3-3]MDY0744759.1 DUF4397 domain-containing protein [Paucibacter sp. R3-3]